MPHDRYSARSITMNGKCYIIGGQTERSISVYDPDEDTFTDVFTMETKRVHFGCCKYSEDEILIVGEGNEINSASDSCIVYNTQTSIIISIANLNEGRKLFALVECGGKFYAIGGANQRKGFTIMKSIEVYDKRVGQWKMNEINLSQQRFCHDAVSHNGYVYVFGGQNHSVDLHNYVEKYDMKNGTSVTLKARMNFKRGGHFGICKIGTKVYLFGGAFKRTRRTGDTYTNKVEVFSLVNENFQVLQDLPKADGFLSACILCND